MTHRVVGKVMRWVLPSAVLLSDAYGAVLFKAAA